MTMNLFLWTHSSNSRFIGGWATYAEYRQLKYAWSGLTWNKETNIIVRVKVETQKEFVIRW